ncbi:ATP-binding protein [Caulobacter segnis]|uniref:hybrid sensor histidine kinase/response regulator n=1 Tax=Caulobacter segnis TaxID=88688 RepID=UPI00285D6EDE|nr:ATP-binding protein [Caulobacter segnis]MDR6627176.1 signal transduction histidine kinase/ActR/RegA family two-component response regulator [Caulobacter segnis]
MIAGIRNPSRDDQSLRIAGLLAAFGGSIIFSLFLAGATHNLPSIWTANAVVIAGLLTLKGNARWVMLALVGLTHVAIELIAGVRVSFILLVVPQDLIQNVLIAWGLERLGLTNHMRSPWGLARMTAVAAVMVIVFSTITTVSLALARGKPMWSGWADWIAPNVLGLFLAMPTTIMLMDRRHKPLFPASAWQLAMLTTLVVVSAVAIFTSDPGLQALLFAPAMLAVFRGGPRAAAILVIASLAASIPAVLHRVGIDRDLALAPLRHAVVFHVMLFAVCLTAAMILERQKRLQALLTRGRDAARHAQASAQAANKAKSEFLATISHEIRTPLNSILGFADLVALDPNLSPDSRRRLDLISRAGRSLVEIINDLLDFSKLEAGRMELDPEPLAPAVVLRDALAIAAPAAETKNLALRIEIIGGDEQALFLLDETRLRQVLLNLLSNAIKFTRDGGVTARLELSGQRLRFEIEDTGIGIAPDVQARLFQRFTQADSSISRGYGGTGLGLAISKALVTRMGGEIGVVSAPGQGARFWVELSATPARPTPELDSAAPQPSNIRGARVLLVDDHHVNRELGYALLTLGGHEAITAEDGAAAVSLVRDQDFDLVLMDVHMPVMDGLSATHAIRAMQGPKARVPILALSADVMPEQIARCLAAGMDGHLAKPIVREALLAAVARFATPSSREASQASLATP